MHYGLLLQDLVMAVFMLGMLGVERCRRICQVDIEITYMLYLFDLYMVILGHAGRALGKHR